MPSSPTRLPERIAVVFDFDETLAPDSTSSFLQSIGVDVEAFWAKRVQALLEQGWDPIPAYLYAIIATSNERPAGRRVTREALADWGSGISMYNGGTRIFSTLRDQAAEINPDIDMEFYLISSGIQDIVSHTRIAKHFTEIWACDFHCNDADEIQFPKNIISFTDKTRYLFQISKGQTGEEARRDPFIVNRRLPFEHFRIPFAQMIFVGDGYTDVPCFSLIERYEGVAVAVYDPDKRGAWQKAWGFVEDKRVSNLVPADYGKNSALHHTLTMAVSNIARRITEHNRSLRA